MILAALIVTFLKVRACSIMKKLCEEKINYSYELIKNYRNIDYF